MDEPTLFGAELQPWTLGRPEALTLEQQLERQQLLSEISSSFLGKTEQRVAWLLQRFPETRDSDTALAVRYWKTFQADVLEKWNRLDLDILFDLDHFETLSRVRRHVQNDLQLFVASSRTRQLRNELQMDFSQYLSASRHTDDEVRFYLDETGNEGGKAYVGVAGICIINWKQYEKHHAALKQWRENQGWPETIHFSETGSAQQPKALALLSELQKRRSGLLFLGYSIPSRGHTHHALVDLFIQLVSDSLRQLEALKCLNSPRALTLIKEADGGFDTIYKPAIEKYLSQQLGRDFPERVFLKQVEPLPKGREVLLECADLIAGGMQRRAFFGGRNPKDLLAEAVFNVTGFEDSKDNGTVFKAHLS